MRLKKPATPLQVKRALALWARLSGKDTPPELRGQRQPVKGKKAK